jgi:hypothetical protein
MATLGCSLKPCSNRVILNRPEPRRWRVWSINIRDCQRFPPMRADSTVAVEHSGSMATKADLRFVW